MGYTLNGVCMCVCLIFREKVKTNISKINMWREKLSEGDHVGGRKKRESRGKVAAENQRSKSH